MSAEVLMATPCTAGAILLQNHISDLQEYLGILARYLELKIVVLCSDRGP